MPLTTRIATAVTRRLSDLRDRRRVAGAFRLVHGPGRVTLADDQHDGVLHLVEIVLGVFREIGRRHEHALVGPLAGQRTDKGLQRGTSNVAVGGTTLQEISITRCPKSRHKRPGDAKDGYTD